MSLLPSDLSISSLTSRENVWKAVGAGAAVLAGAAVSQLLVSSWKAVTNDDPPLNPASSETSWKDAIAWTVATSIVVGVARLLARRGADALWTKAVGSPPPNRNEVAVGH